MCLCVKRCSLTPEEDVRSLNKAAVHPLKSSYKGQLIRAGYTGGRDMKVSEPSAELINLCLNEATHLSPCALTTLHHIPPSHHVHPQMCYQVKILGHRLKKQLNINRYPKSS